MEMSFLETLFTGYSAMQAVVVIFLIIVAGLVLGRIKVAGISLGVTFVFFCGILAGHFGLSVDPKMLTFAQNFGLIIFVYALGLQVGPGFFNAFRKGGMDLNVLGMGVILIGTFMAVAFTWFTPVSLPDMIGVLCGATTNTPALGAAQQTLDQLGMDSTSPALGCRRNPRDGPAAQDRGPAQRPGEQACTGRSNVYRDVPDPEPCRHRKVPA